MNIKEKAIEIAGLCNGCLQGKDQHPDIGCCSCEMRGKYYGAMEMGQWFLDKACEWLLENAIFSQSEVTDRFDEEDLVSRFREAMEQQ